MTALDGATGALLGLACGDAVGTTLEFKRLGRDQGHALVQLSAAGRPACPHCGAALLPIVYGMPGLELADAAGRGEVLLGGCVVSDHDHAYGCESCDQRWPADGRGIPLVLVAEIGGYHGENITAELAVDGELTVTVDGMQGSSVLSADQQSGLWDAVDAAGVWRWRERYDEPGVLDGTHWFLFAHHAGRRAEVSGSNRFPRGFRTLSAALGKVIGRRFE